MELSPITPASTNTTGAAPRTADNAQPQYAKQYHSQQPPHQRNPLAHRMSTSTPQTLGSSSGSGNVQLTSGPLESVFIQRVPGQRLGLRVVGGVDTQLMAVFVDDITADTAAAASNIRYGDRLVAADGISLLNQARDRVVDILRGAGSTLTLVVQHLGDDQWHDIKAEAAYRLERKLPHLFAMREAALPLLRSDPSPLATTGLLEQITLLQQHEWIEVCGGCGSVLGGFFVTRASASAAAALPVGTRVVDVNNRSFLLSKMWDLQQLVQHAPVPVRLTIQRIDRDQWLSLCDATEFDAQVDTRNPAVIGGSDKPAVASQLERQRQSIVDPAAANQRLSTISTASSVPSTHPLSAMQFPTPPPPGPPHADQANALPTSAHHQHQHQHPGRADSSLPHAHIANDSNATSATFNSTDAALHNSRVVSLGRGTDGNLGFAIIGAAAGRTPPSAPRLQGAFVKEVTATSAFDAGLCVGDRIVAINGRRVANETADAVIDFLVTLDAVDLHVVHSPRDMVMLEAERRASTQPRRVVISGVQQHGLGISLLQVPPRAARGSSNTNTNNASSVNNVTGDGSDGEDQDVDGTEGSPVFVSGVLQGSAAALDGRVKAADQVLSINNVAVTSPRQALRLIRACSESESVTLVLQATDLGYQTLRKALVADKLSFVLKGEVLSFRIPASGRLGLKLSGGFDTPLAGIFVDEVKPNSIAASLGIAVGDLVLSLQREGMLKRSRREIASIFRTKAFGSQLRVLRLGPQAWQQYQTECLRVDVARPAIPCTELPFTRGANAPVRTSGPIIPVVVSRHAGEACGFNITGGTDDDMNAFFVSQVDQAGPSFGLLRAGDRILEVRC